MLLLCSSDEAQISEWNAINPTHGKDDQVLHTGPLPEKGGEGSPARTEKGNRVLLNREEVSLAWPSGTLTMGPEQ
jgi:hypothetical protein